MGRNKTRLITATLILGASIFLAGVLGDGRIDTGDLRAIGLVTLTAGFTVTVLYWCRISCYERARQDGYDTGYNDGCQVAPSAVVQFIPRPPAAHPIFRDHLGR